ncbi:MAG: universal stress protein [Solirubrobacteraceae bacterium]|nr:universal stress protein [Solirubrobacteraceae bacterium]
MTAALFTNILVGSDGSDSAAQAVERAAVLTEASGGKLEILGAVEKASDQAKLSEKLAASASELTERGLTVSSRVTVGDAVEVILETANELDVDLIVLGNKGMTGARRFILGSIPDKVSHRATQSVMIARTV